MMKELRRLFDAYHRGGVVSMEYRTRVYAATGYDRKSAMKVPTTG